MDKAKIFFDGRFVYFVEPDFAVLLEPDRIIQKNTQTTNAHNASTSGMFEFGQAMTALARVRTLGDISIGGFNPEHADRYLPPYPEVVGKFYDAARAPSARKYLGGACFLCDEPLDTTTYRIHCGAADDGKRCDRWVCVDCSSDKEWECDMHDCARCVICRKHEPEPSIKCTTCSEYKLGVFYHSACHPLAGICVICKCPLEPGAGAVSGFPAADQVPASQELSPEDGTNPT